MIASPTAASAAATVMTMKTNTWPVMPYAVENATKVRFTALSMSSMHMKMMIALRRVSTPTTPIVNSTAEKNRASASIGVPPLLAEDHGTDHRRKQQHARDLERQQVRGEQRGGNGADDALLGDLDRHRAPGRQPERRRRLEAGDGHHLGEDREPERTGRDLPPASPRIVQLLGIAQVEQHDDEQEDDHDRAGVDDHLDRADE